MKKFLLMITIFLCITSTVFASGDYVFNGETVPAKSWRTDTFYGVDTIRNVLDALEISYTDTTLVAYTHYANKFMKFYRATYDENATALNMCIAKTSSGTVTSFTIIPSNGSFSNTLPYAYVNEYASTSYTGVNAFVNWNYNTTTGAINGANNTNIPYGVISVNNYSISNSRATIYPTSEDYQQEGNLYYKNLLSPIRTFAVAGQTRETGYSWYFLTNTIEFSATAGEDEESGDTGGGTDGDTSGSVDLTMTNQKIDELNRHAEEIKNKIPTSGEIQQATTSGVIQGNTDYWGSSGDISGEYQEELINGKIDELTEQISGDLAKSEIFGILQTYEDKLFGSFTGEEDFKIEWPDVSFMDNVIIPAGSVNFSEICRENEALGNVKSTINIILSFIILMNIVIYMYNLLLATLGIDNPYLYEKPVGSVTVAEYTDEDGRTFVTRTQHDGRGNSISKRYNHTREPKKRQIGFRRY